MKQEFNESEHRKKVIRGVLIGLTSWIVTVGITGYALYSNKEKSHFYEPKYRNTSENIKIGTYRGRRVETLDKDDLRKVWVYGSNFTPDIKSGLISAVDTNKDGTFDLINEDNLIPNDSLEEFTNSSELEEAYSRVQTNGFYQNERRSE